MKHSISLSGLCYRLRPAEIGDADFIIKVRTGYAERSKYVHAISSDISVQQSWIEDYYTRKGDYYFVIENQLTAQCEGLIGIYNFDSEKKTAEWGRWIVLPESLCSTESVCLMYRIAFEVLGLESVYSRTIKDNTSVVSFHDSLCAENQGILLNEFEIDGKKYDAVKHFVDQKIWNNAVKEKVERISQMIYEKKMKHEIEKMEFHHIGVATHDKEKERVYWEVLGYTQEGESFSDELQGISGIFMIAKNQPRIELLENISGSHTLDTWLAKGIKFYHFAYLVEDIDSAIFLYTKKFRGKLLSPKKPSIAFGLRNICFIVFSNGLIIELIERA